MSTSLFAHTLEDKGLQLTRGTTATLQINVGRMCDLACRHCHLEAGPDRPELMSRDTSEAVIACAERFRFATIDLTGGAPELLPQLPDMITRLAPLTGRLIVRTNLTALALPGSAGLPELYRDHRVAIVASLPAVNRSQSEAQRGEGSWEASIAMLTALNAIGYGMPGSGLELDLVANPTGAFLPPGQAEADRRFHQDLQRRYGIAFSSLFTFANVPLGRFGAWLEQSGNREAYRERLSAAFNPCTLPGLMCRSLIAVDWDGCLYDCDFNLAAGLPHRGSCSHISQLIELPPEGTPIPVGDHCFACTAGSGFT